MAAAAAPFISAYEDLPPYMTSASEAPPLFDDTTRLYLAYDCPYAQLPWIARNYKGLHDKIKLVAIDLADKPAWYKEKVYPNNKVPALEHNNQVKGESLDLLKYIDSNFEGPELLPDVDIAYVTFIDKLQIALSGLKNYHIAKGRPNIPKFLEEANKMEAYIQTKQDQQLVLDQIKEHFGIA